MCVCRSWLGANVPIKMSDSWTREPDKKFFKDGDHYKELNSKNLVWLLRIQIGCLCVCVCVVPVLIYDSHYCENKNCQHECSNLFISNQALYFICMRVQDYNVSILADSMSGGGRWPHTMHIIVFLCMCVWVYVCTWVCVRCAMCELVAALIRAPGSLIGHNRHRVTQLHPLRPGWFTQTDCDAWQAQVYKWVVLS